MPSLSANPALLCALAGISCVASVRVDGSAILNVNASSLGRFPANIIGMSPEDLWERLGEDIYPYLQADIVYMRRIRQASPNFWNKMFADAKIGRYSEMIKSYKVKESVAKAIISIVGIFTNFGDPMGTADTIAGWIGDGKDWTDWLVAGQHTIIDKGQDAPLRYITTAAMGNLWEAMLNVNAIQMVPSEGTSIRALRAEPPYDFADVPVGTVMTPVTKGGDGLLVVWEDARGKPHRGWVKQAEIVPALYMVSSSVDIMEQPDFDAPLAQRMEAGNVFAVTKKVRDYSGVWWMKLSDGRGYVREGVAGYTGPVHRAEKADPKRREALGKAYEANTGLPARCARLAFNVGMFAAGFHTFGATWTIAAAANTVDVGGSHLLEAQAMSDLDVHLEYLMMQLRTREFMQLRTSQRCNVASEQPCKEEGFKCVRELAFIEKAWGPAGSGWCMKDARPRRPNGEHCLVHADCESGNCVPRSDCSDITCLETRCRPFRFEGK